MMSETMSRILEDLIKVLKPLKSIMTLMSTETYQPFAEGDIEIHDSSTITELKSWKADAKICTEPEAWIQDLSF